jgi:type 1 glutamine amidotransferase
MLATLVLAFAALQAQPRLPVLVVSGANNHDWEWTTPSLVALLERSGRFEVDVTYEPAVTLADAERVARYRAFVLDYNGPRWGAVAEANFLAAVRSGTGVAVIHAANNAFPGWQEYEELVALCWRDGTGHGKFHPFDVAITDRDHPITHGLPDLRAHPDELYHKLVHMHGTDFRVLATAFSDPATGGTGAHEPMVIVKQHGDGRVFHTPLGHVWANSKASHASHEDLQFQNLIVRGVEWAASGRVSDGAAQPNALSGLERAAGWELLFDGATLAGWRGLGAGPVPPGWSVRDGCLVVQAGGEGSALVTDRVFGDFELELEWKTTRGANSGIKYRVPEASVTLLGPEYQILDAAHADAGSALASSAALYALCAAEGAELRPTGAFNHARIVSRGDRLEHWLNGRRVMTVDVGSDEWRRAVAASKFAAVPGFGAAPRGLIGLQDHGDEVWFRSIRVRDLERLPGERVALFDGESLAGWRELGDAEWTVADGVLHGTVGGGAQSFLVTERTYGDFILEVDVRAGAGNSGIQMRSAETPEGRATGYQIEIDPSERAWSGGLYEEAGRGWLDDLSDNPAGRAAFRKGEWNRYRIECIGPSIRAWVDGVPTADWLDAARLEGFIGLQVHKGDDCEVSWRNFELRDLGRRAWRPALAADGGPLVPREHAGAWDGDVGTDFALRFELPPAPAKGLDQVSFRQQDQRLEFTSGDLGELLPRGEIEVRSPGLCSWDERWMLWLTDPSIAQHLQRDRNTVTLCAFGERIAVDVNGNQVIAFSMASAGGAGLSLRAPGAKALELLVGPH